jgi:hypothetical protein
MAHPVDEWGEALGLGTIIDVAAGRGDRPACFKFEVLGDGALRRLLALNQSSDPTIRSNTARALDRLACA